MRHFCSIAALVASLVVVPNPAQACRDDDQRPAVEDVKLADLVVAGRIANYSVVDDYARFDILVDEVLVGEAPEILTVTVDYPLYRELDFMLPGPYLIALRDPRSLPTRGYTPNPSPILMTVLQEGCSPAFIFETMSKEAAEVRRILGSKAK